MVLGAKCMASPCVVPNKTGPLLAELATGDGRGARWIWLRCWIWRVARAEGTNVGMNDPLATDVVGVNGLFATDETLRVVDGVGVVEERVSAEAVDVTVWVESEDCNGWKP